MLRLLILLIALFTSIKRKKSSIRDYLVERLPNNLFIYQFLFNPSEIDARRTGNTTRYLDLTTEVKINDSLNMLNYLRQRSDMDEMTFSDRLHNGSDVLNQIENWTEKVHYQGYSPKTNEVIFQRYVQGYPVYSYQQFESVIEIAVVESGLTSFQFPFVLHRNVAIN